MTALTFMAAALLMSAALSAAMAGAWLVQQKTGNSGWVDTVWTFSLGIIGATAALAPIGSSSWPTPRQIIVALFLVLWSLRLGGHIASRTAGITDDPRYAEL